MTCPAPPPSGGGRRTTSASTPPFRWLTSSTCGRDERSSHDLRCCGDRRDRGREQSLAGRRAPPGGCAVEGGRLRRSPVVQAGRLLRGLGPWVRRQDRKSTRLNS